MLTSVGFEPVHADPAHPSYLAASAAHAVAPSPEPVHAPDPHAPDTILVPFETTITIPNEMSLRHGLVPLHGHDPGRQDVLSLGVSRRP